MNSETFRCWAEVDQEALRHNARVVRKQVGSGVNIVAVVKANGYGHGMIGVAKALAQEVQIFGVANLEEAVTLRRELSHPIILLGPVLPTEWRLVAEAGFIPSISNLEEAQDFSRVAQGKTVEVNFVIDTGMGRMGVSQSDALDLFAKVVSIPHIRIHSLSTHLPVSDEDKEFTRTELQQFADIVKRVRTDFPGDYKAHVLPSTGVLAYADVPFDMVRAGLMLYGISPFRELQKLLRPALSWKTRIALVRDLPKGHGISYGRTFITPHEMRVATLSAGYADGYPRHLSNQDAAVLVNGRRCPLLGRITMDLMMIDVSQIEDAKVGNEVVLLGRQGDEEISATELADRANTITWEITTRIGSRVRRVYV